MLQVWNHDLESLEAISQDDDTKRIFLRMANLSQTGGLRTFLIELERDADIDDDTKGTLSELAQERLQPAVLVQLRHPQEQVAGIDVLRDRLEGLDVFRP